MNTEPVARPEVLPPAPDPSFPPADQFWAHPVRPPHRKFQHRYSRHVLFFVLTFFTTTFKDVIAYALVALFSPRAGIQPLSLFTWSAFAGGLWYSLPLLAILSAHEFGHYFACRYHNVDATLPYFIPAPLPLTGTFGAVIRIREPFPSKSALFDIGVAGPLAGFIVLVPFLFWGISLSEVTRLPNDGSVIYFGEPLLWKAVAWLHFGTLPSGFDVALHPLGFAAWWGMLATALNLLPFGQLDGGHIMYAALGRRATLVSGLTLAVVVTLTVLSASWTTMAVMLAVMAVVFGFRHPRIPDEADPLSPRRRMVALAALIVFVLCFTPVPIDTSRP